MATHRSLLAGDSTAQAHAERQRSHTLDPTTHLTSGMPHVVVLQHQKLVGPGSIPDLVQARGWTLQICRLDLGDPLPDALTPGQILVVLGGTMGVADRRDPAYPWMEAEIELIQARLQAQSPVLGLCLGAQLLAHAAGGAVEPLCHPKSQQPLPEVGCGAVQWRPAAAEEAILAGLAPCEPAFFWHGDRVRLPDGAELLASTLVCREQVFRIGPVAWGLQFHAEITTAMARSWIAAAPEFVRSAHGPEGVGRLLADLDLWGPTIETRNRLLLGNLLEVMAQHAGS